MAAVLVGRVSGYTMSSIVRAPAMGMARWRAGMVEDLYRGGRAGDGETLAMGHVRVPVGSLAGLFRRTGQLAARIFVGTIVGTISGTIILGTSIFGTNIGPTGLRAGTTGGRSAAIRGADLPDSMEGRFRNRYGRQTGGSQDRGLLDPDRTLDR